MLFKRFDHGGRVRVGSAPFPGFAPNGVDCADAPRQRIDVIQIPHDFLLVRNGDAETGDGKLARQLHKIAKLAGGHQHRHIDGVDAAQLERPIVDHRRQGMSHGIGNDTEDLGGAGEPVRAVLLAQLAGRNLSGSGAFGGSGRGVGEDTIAGGREHARGKSGFTHCQNDQRDSRIVFADRQHAAHVGRLTGRGDQFVGVGGDTRETPQRYFQVRRGFKVVPGDDETRSVAQGGQLGNADLGGFDFHIHGLSPMIDGGVQNRQFVFDAALETSVVVMAAAGGEERRLWMRGEKRLDRGKTLFGLVEIIEPKLEERFPVLDFPFGMLQQGFDARQAKRDADFRKGLPRGHEQREVEDSLPYRDEFARGAVVGDCAPVKRVHFFARISPRRKS